MVEALPAEGAIVVVHSASERSYISSMIRDLRGKAVFDACKIVVFTHPSDAEKLKSDRRKIFVDHAVHDALSFINAAALQAAVESHYARSAGGAS